MQPELSGGPSRGSTAANCARLAFGVFVALALAGSTRAEIVNATGKVDWMLGAPADARLRGDGSITGSMLARAWDETQNFTLATDLTVDAVAAGVYDRPSSLGMHVISAGTEISSHALLLKPPGPRAIAGATLSFSSEILGVILSDSTSARRAPGLLAQSDYLGGSTIFDSELLNRGLELGSDTFSIAPDHLSITFSLNASNPGDFARIITRSSTLADSESFSFGGSSGLMLWDWEAEREPSTPAPSAACLAGVCALGALRRRRPCA